MTELGKLTVPVEAETSKFVQAMRQAQTALDKFSGSAEKNNRSLASSLKGTATEMNSMWSIAQRVTGSFKALFAAAADGARFADTEKFFRNSGKSLEDFRQATRGLLSDSELFKKANLADSMGISGDAFKKLANVAYAASLKTGQSYEHMLDSIVTGTARGSRLLLDNLGIIVSVKEANERYAKQVGKSTDALSDFEKKQAFVNEVMRKSQGMTKELADIGESTAEVFDRLGASAENAADSIKKNMASALTSWASALSGLLDEFASLPPWAQAFILGGGGAGAAAGFAVGGIPGAIIGAAAGAGLGLGAAMEEQDKAFAAMQEKMKRQAELLRIMESSASAGGIMGRKKGTALAQDVLGLNKQQISGMLGSSGDAGEITDPRMYAFAKAAEEFNALNTETNLFTKKLREATGAVDENTEGAGGKGKKGPRRGIDWKWLEDQAQVQLGIDDTTFQKQMEHAKEMDRLDALWLAGLDETQTALWTKAGEIAEAQAPRDIWEKQTLQIEAYTRLRDSTQKLTEAQEYHDKVIREAAIKQAEWTDSQKGINAAAPFVQAAGSGDAGGAIGALVSGIQTALADSTSVISQFLTSLLGDLAGPVGAIIGLIVSVLGPAIAALEPVVSLFGSIGKMVGELVRLGFQPLLETLRPLETVFITLGIALGALIGALLGPLVDILQFVLPWLALGLTGVAAALMFLEPIVRLFSDLFFFGGGALAGFLEGLTGINLMSATFVEGANSIRLFSWTLLTAAMDFNNFIVTMMRKVLGDKYGDKYSAQERDKIRQAIFGTDNGPGEDEENTDAVKENTKAVRDLAREFKNLPSGYKIAAADFATSRGTARPVIGGVLSGAAADFANQRAGDQYRWWR